jgi:hypothetical protein
MSNVLLEFNIEIVDTGNERYFKIRFLDDSNIAIIPKNLFFDNESIKIGDRFLYSIRPYFEGLFYNHFEKVEI